MVDYLKSCSVYVCASLTFNIRWFKIRDSSCCFFFHYVSFFRTCLRHAVFVTRSHRYDNDNCPIPHKSFKFGKLAFLVFNVTPKPLSMNCMLLTLAQSSAGEYFSSCIQKYADRMVMTKTVCREGRALPRSPGVGNMWQ